SGVQQEVGVEAAPAQLAYHAEVLDHAARTSLRPVAEHDDGFDSWNVADLAALDDRRDLDARRELGEETRHVREMRRRAGVVLGYHIADVRFAVRGPHRLTLLQPTSSRRGCA